MSGEEPAPAAESGKKPSLFAQISDFVNNMDSRAWRALAVTFGLFVVVGAMLVAGRLLYGDVIEQFIRSTFAGAEREHWGLPATIAVFTLTAYVGAPQIVLIGACVLAFGPEVGFWYAWIATIVSGAVTFFTGKFGGANVSQRYRGATGGRFTRFMGKNGFLASFLAGFVPTAAFIVVNMSFGAAGVGFWAFIAGLAFGVLPKTAIVAFAGDGIMDALEGDLGSAAIMGAVAIVLWFVGVVLIRKFVRPDDRPNGGSGQ
jgi:uncharacterized membrane protein YdjX (TVP38/TMEM64 family)